MGKRMKAGAVKFTANWVAKIEPTDARQEIPDALTTGLYLVIQPSGAKSWAVRYRHGGRPRKHTLGSSNALDLGDARKAAKATLLVVAEGKDPASDRRVARQEAAEGRNLISNVAADFLDRHAKNLRSRGELERMLRKDVLPAWGKRQIQDISRRDVIELLDGLTDRGIGAYANRVFAVVRALFNFCVSRDVLTASPCTGMRAPVPEISRDRVLTDDEIRRFWKASGTLSYPFRDLVRLMLATGQRLSEVAGMAWSELDLDKRLWSLPTERTKNGRPHDVPLSDLAIEILEGLPKIAGQRPLVLTTTGKTPVSGFSKAKRNLDAAMAANGSTTPAWHLHDLRRTLATGLQRLAIPPHVTEAVLNHKSGIIRGVAAVYARHDYAAEKRTALDVWARWLTALVEGQPDNNVVQLSPARA